MQAIKVRLYIVYCSCSKNEPVAKTADGTKSRFQWYKASTDGANSWMFPPNCWYFGPYEGVAFMGKTIQTGAADRITEITCELEYCKASTEAPCFVSILLFCCFFFLSNSRKLYSRSSRILLLLRNLRIFNHTNIGSVRVSHPFYSRCGRVLTLLVLKRPIPFRCGFCLSYVPYQSDAQTGMEPVRVCTWCGLMWL